MKDSQKHHTGGEIKKARQSSSMGLIIRQKEPTNLWSCQRFQSAWERRDLLLSLLKIAF
jgi:hypothetical protein